MNAVRPAVLADDAVDKRSVLLGIEAFYPRRRNQTILQSFPRAEHFRRNVTLRNDGREAVPPIQD